MDTTEERRIAPMTGEEVKYLRGVLGYENVTFRYTSDEVVRRLIARLDLAEAVVEAAETLTTEFFVTRNERQWEPDAAAAFDRLVAVLDAWDSA